MSSITAEIEATNYQTIIQALVGRPITKAEALEGLRLHEEVGDGGNTVGWKFDGYINGTLECSHKQHTVLGDNICELGRLTKENPLIKWAFPETYKGYDKPDESGKLKFI